MLFKTAKKTLSIALAALMFSIFSVSSFALEKSSIKAKNLSEVSTSSLGPSQAPPNEDTD